MTDPRNALRQQLRQTRRNLPPKERIAAAESVAGQLLALPFLPESGHVAGIVNPPGKKTWVEACGEPDRRAPSGLPADPSVWRESAERRSVSWWEDWAT